MNIDIDNPPVADGETICFPYRLVSLPQGNQPDQVTKGDPVPKAIESLAEPRLCRKYVAFLGDNDGDCYVKSHEIS